MRIIGGKKRGIRLAEVGKGDAANHLRPTTDRVRETLFNILNNHIDFENHIVLDLFAGTGALGLEALSRGAKECLFVDDGRTAQKLLAQNIKRCEAAAKVISQDATRAVLPVGFEASLVFLDPPYGKGLVEKTLGHITAHIEEDALIVCEDNCPIRPPDGFKLRDQRQFGETWITLLDAP